MAASCETPRVNARVRHGFRRGLLSHPFHKAVHRALVAGVVELDRQLVAVDRGHVAVAELLVEYAVTDRKVGHRAGRFGDQLVLDRERSGAAGAGEAASFRSATLWAGVVILRQILIQAAARAAGAALCALPARRGVARAEMGHVVEARGALIGAAPAAAAALGPRHLPLP